MNVLLIAENESPFRELKKLLPLACPSDPSITVATTASEAKQHLASHPCQLVLLDLTIPGNRDYALIKNIADSKLETATIAIDQADDKSHALAALASGAHDYLAGDLLTEANLRRSVRYALERKQSANKLQDLTQQLEKTLSELQEVQRETIRRERLSAIGNMAAGIAHDFNNALSPILANTDYLLEYPEALEQKESCLSLLQSTKEAAEKAGSIVRRLKSFYEPSSGSIRYQAIDLNDLVREVIELAKPHWKDEAQAAGKQIRVLFEPKTETKIQGNPSELQDALLNILMNAIDAIKGDGEIQFDLSTQASEAILVISDTGCGMDESNLRDCFEPFHTTKGHAGTGLGLSAVYGIIKRHKGKISVASKLDDGSRFTIKLPQSQTKLSSTSDKASKPQKPNFKVLLVDDEPSILQVAQMILQREGHSCVKASDGAEALTQLTKHDFDLVITDRAMPRMNGDKLAVKIHEKRPELYIVMLTGYGDLMAATEERPPHIAEVVPKPFTSQTLRYIIDTYQQSRFPEGT